MLFFDGSASPWRSAPSSPAYRTYVSRLVPELDYQELDGVHHFVMLERPDLFNPLLTDFLKTIGVM